MSIISIIKISRGKHKYKEIISDFRDCLSNEAKFIYIPLDRIIKAHTLFVAMDGEKIVGVSGLEKKYGIVLSKFIIINKNYQGEKFSRQLTKTLINESLKNNLFIMAVNDVRNIKAWKHNIATGAKIIGQRQNLYHLFWFQSGVKGKMIFHFLKLIFPLVKIVDQCRRSVVRLH